MDDALLPAPPLDPELLLDPDEDPDAPPDP
jgi:hypothetical protein